MKRRSPRPAAFDENYLQLREAFENAFHYETGDERLHALPMSVVLFDEERRPAAAGRRIAVDARAMQPDRKPVLGGRLVDRPIALASQRLGAAWCEHDLDKRRVSGAAIDFGDGRVRILVWDHQRCPKTRLRLNPLRELPVVDCTAHG